MSSKETQTYWCHQCDMSIQLLSTPSTTLVNCPECNQNNSLELMDPIPNSIHSSFLLLDDSHFIQHYNCLTSSSSSLYKHDHDDDGEFFTCLSIQNMGSSLLTVKITSLMLELDSVIVCAVCKEEFELNSEVKKLPCHHLFHHQCILTWLNIHPSCPLCRFSLPTSSLTSRTLFLESE